MSVQRDYGNRADRARARFKYTVDDKGVDWIRAEIERRMGADFDAQRPYRLTSNGDLYGWQQTDAGRWNYTLFIENGRVIDRPGRPLMAAIRAIAQAHRGRFRLTPNQNLIVADVEPGDRAAIDGLLAEHGLADNGRISGLRRNSMACVALPTCPLAMAEAERYLPELITRVDAILVEHGLGDEAITMRMTGCPNGCARPYVAEIAFTGRAPGKYNLYLGGGFHGERLNRLYRENIGEAAILEILGEMIGRYARERGADEHFGDFVLRAGYFEALA
jgi:sulfite reductase (NADPH) hemoprotein beta-component